MLVEGAPGRLAMLPCPGWSDPHARDAGSQPAVRADLRRLAALGASMLVSLLGDEELASLGAAHVGALCAELHLAWAQCPIVDFEPPGIAFEQAWVLVAPVVHRRLDRGELVGLHCRGGLGRSGTIAARILIERGAAPADAIATVRRHRPGAIETAGQEAHLNAISARPEWRWPR